MRCQVWGHGETVRAIVRDHHGTVVGSHDGWSNSTFASISLSRMYPGLDQQWITDDTIVSELNELFELEMV